MVKKLHLLSFLAALMIALGVNAQVTTSAMSGVVTDSNEALIGATVQAVHTPSGTKYNAVTNMDGRYSMQGMRTGGPYTVTVTYVGYQPKVYEQVILQLGETYNLDVLMDMSTSQLSEVVVIGTNTKFTTEKTGASTNITNAQITSLPSVTRSITDITRLSPYGGNGMSFAGTDGRTANFTVDGANFNNNFGLSESLPGGGNPISLEAIEEMQVVISPYDVRQTNFIGGGVNAITKSGTNLFRGSAYFYHRNENLRGDAVNHEQIGQAREKDRVSTYGFTASGPIVKDKLFFFVNGEMTKKPTIVNRWVASAHGDGDAEHYVSRTLLSDLQRVSDFVREKYGYNTGSFTHFPADENNYKILARLDWNITEMHHLALRYNYTKNRYWSNPNMTSMDGGTRMPSSRVSQNSFSFAKSMYAMDNLVHSFSLDLNSRLADNLSNQFLATFSKLDDVRASDSSEFPFIDITMTDADGNRDNYMSLGYELFTWNNAVHNTVWNVRDDVTFLWKTHKFMAGLSFEHQMADNQYMRNGTGYYRYRSVDDFINGAAPEIVALTYGYDGESSPAARVTTNKAGIYAQDEWNVTKQFKLTYGLRLDGLFFDNSDLMTNKAIYDLNYYDKDGNVRHIDTGKWPSNNIIIQPRVGFTYDVFGDKSLKLRGGTGLFSGRLPLVFLTNMPTNSGMVQYQAALSGNTKVWDGKTNAPTRGFENYSGAYVTDANGNRYIDMSQFSGGLVTENGQANIDALRNRLIAMGYPSTVRPEDGTVPSSISAVDPSYKMPMVWKTTLAADYVIPVSFPFTATVEGMFTKNINQTSITDWSIPSVGGFSRFNGVDNRPIYPAGFRTGTKAFVLRNTSRGYGWIANVTLNARPAEWLSLMASYTHTVNKEVTGLPGNAAESAFTYVPTVEGPNNIKLHNSQYVTPDRIVATATGHDKSGNHYSLVYETWRGGYNYSYMMVNDMNSDGYNYDALYVPTDEQVANREFRFVSDNDRDRFMDYVHNSSYLSSRQGKYAEPYSLYNPWVHRVDFAYKHDFKFNVGSTHHTLQVGFDIKNLLNLFNSSWGVSKIINSSFPDGRILKYEGVDADGYATFSTPAAINGDTKTFRSNHAIGQCWNASISFKYIFN
ncbi:MAG: TonB-dependent receptor [Muribaculaceae bacterium]|nr:TonB-dependent receptor [Muribaculaceae bacterium]